MIVKNNQNLEKKLKIGSPVFNEMINASVGTSLEETEVALNEILLKYKGKPYYSDMLDKANAIIGAKLSSYKK